MIRYIGRKMATLGLWLARIGLKAQGAKYVASVSLYDPAGIKCVALTSGEGVNVDFLLAAAGKPPEQIADVRVLVEGQGFLKLYGTEPDARWFLAGYFSVTDDKVRVTLFVNGTDRKFVEVTADTFDPRIPLFPLEASAV